MTKPGIVGFARADEAARDLLAAFRHIFGYLPESSYDVRGGVVRMASGLSFPPFNGVAITRTDVGTAEVLSAVDDFAAGSLPWNVQLRAGYPAVLDAELAGRGLIATGDIPLMVLDDAAALRAAVASTPLDYRRVGVTELQRYNEVMAAGFDMPPAVIGEFMVPALVTDPRLHVLIGRRDGVDVTTGLSIRVGDGAGIFNVATPPAYRGRGYGAAVTAVLVQRALAAGSQWAWLQASPMGLPVYERLGFRTVETWRQWMPSEQLSLAD